MLEKLILIKKKKEIIEGDTQNIVDILRSKKGIWKMLLKRRSPDQCIKRMNKQEDIKRSTAVNLHSGNDKDGDTFKFKKRHFSCWITLSVCHFAFFIAVFSNSHFSFGLSIFLYFPNGIVQAVDTVAFFLCLCFESFWQFLLCRETKSDVKYIPPYNDFFSY